MIAPLVLLVGLRALLAPAAQAAGEQARTARLCDSACCVLVAATVSTLLALRAAPVGFDDRAGRARAPRPSGSRASRSSSSASTASPATTCAGTLARAPAGYVPEEIAARPEKTWQQGLAADFDTVESGKLDKFGYAITTAAAYASTPPRELRAAARARATTCSGSAAGRRRAAGCSTARAASPGALLDCDASSPSARASPSVLARAGRGRRYTDWTAARAGRARRRRPGARLRRPRRGDGASSALPTAGRYALSLQYHSQVPLEVLVDGEPVAELPPSLDGMYLDGAGRGAFWPAGELERGRPRPGRGRRSAPAEPSGLQDALGVERRVWLGDLAATPAADPCRGVASATPATATSTTSRSTRGAGR